MDNSYLPHGGEYTAEGAVRFKQDKFKQVLVKLQELETKMSKLSSVLDKLVEASNSQLLGSDDKP
jgi:hypothetical protein